jgi:hypothetical protein
VNPLLWLLAVLLALLLNEKRVKSRSQKKNNHPSPLHNVHDLSQFTIINRIRPS